MANSNGWVTSKKYKGVRRRKLQNGDTTYQIRFRYKKKLYEKHIGRASQNITEEFCFNQRIRLLNELKFGEHAPKPKHGKRERITVQDLADEYFEHTSDNKSHHQILGKYNLYIKPEFGDAVAETVTQSDVKKWKKKLEKAKLAPKTIDGYIDTLATIYNHAIKNGRKIINPCSGIKRSNYDNSRARYLTLDEIGRLKEACKGNQKVYTFVMLSLSTGGRRGTVLSIQRKDIDFEEGIVTLTNYKSSSKTYRGFLDKYALEHLKEIGAEKLPPNYYVVGMSDKPVPGKTIYNNLQPILDRLFNQGIEQDDRKNRVVIHTLRHTFASHLAIKGASIYLIKELMNHKDIKDTLRYAKLSPTSGRKEVFDVYSSS